MRLLKFLVSLCVMACGPEGGPPVTPPPPPPPVYAVWRVPGDFPTIQEAFDAASDGDTVLLSSGVYEGDGNRDLVLSGKAVALIGRSGSDSCVIDAGGPTSPDHWCLAVNSSGPRDVLIRGVTLRNASTPPLGHHGGLYVTVGRVRLERCRVEGNDGGGIGILQSSRASLEDCVVSRNRRLEPFTTSGGIFVADRCELDMVDCVVSENYAAKAGGIGAAGALVRLENVHIFGNLAEEYGGGMKSVQAFVQCYRCVFSDNLVTQGGGGGIFLESGDLTLEECTIAGNYGDGIYTFGHGQIVAKRTILWGNCADDCVLEFQSSIALDSCLVDTAKIQSETPDQVTRSGTMVYEDPRFCLFQGCGRPADYRLESDSPARLAGGVVIGALRDTCP